MTARAMPTVESDLPPEPRDENDSEVIYVTKTVASVLPDGTGNLHPVEAAFVGIAKDDSEGRYEFAYRGMRTVVTVERDYPDESR